MLLLVYVLSDPVQNTFCTTEESPSMFKQLPH
jgi:hypothetical protein